MKIIDLAKERGWVVKTHTIKISDPNNPFGAECQNFNVEIHLDQNTQKELWIGYSFNTDNAKKLKVAKDLKKFCEENLSKLSIFKGQYAHETEGRNYKQKHVPGEANSYLYYCIKVSINKSKTLDALQELLVLSKDHLYGVEH